MGQYRVNISELNSFEDIIKHVDVFGVGFIAVVDDKDKLLGIVTDGDIRKALLNQRKNIEDIINANPLTLSHTTSKEQIIAFLRKNKRFHVPLIDEKGVLKEVFLLNKFDTEYKDNYVVVMAGGLGSRLGDLTKNTPKPMLEIKGRPILAYTIESFKNQGFNKFIFCVNYKKEIIEEYFKDGKDFGVSIEYIVEDKRLGTAGALSLIQSKKMSAPFFVINADVIANLDYQSILEFYKFNKASAVMCTKAMHHTNPYAEVTFDEQYNLLELKEKPTKNFDINLGVYLISSKVKDLLKKNEFYDMPNLFVDAVAKNMTVKVFRVNDDWVDIGKPKDYLAIRND